jgi:hypothetical protein
MGYSACQENQMITYWENPWQGRELELLGQKTSHFFLRLKPYFL